MAFHTLLKLVKTHFPSCPSTAPWAGQGPQTVKCYPTAVDIRTRVYPGFTHQS